jgi:hypothetical protein
VADEVTPLAIPPTATPAGFLDEDNGNHSSMRLMCLMSLVSAIGYAVMIKMGRYEMNQYDMIIFMAFLVGAFVPKSIQKLAEVECEKKG